jgi:hypothetical protein
LWRLFHAVSHFRWKNSIAMPALRRGIAPDTRGLIIQRGGCFLLKFPGIQYDFLRRLAGILTEFGELGS